MKTLVLEASAKIRKMDSDTFTTMKVVPIVVGVVMFIVAMCWQINASWNQMTGTKFLWLSCLSIVFCLACFALISALLWAFFFFFLASGLVWRRIQEWAATEK